MKKGTILYLVCLIISCLFTLPALAGTTSYEYDDLHRLTRVARGDGSVTTYNYDALGNRTSKVVTIPSTPSGVDFNNLNLITYSNQGGSGTVTPEDNGATLHIEGNNWVRTEETYIITADTVLEFDFQSTVEGEIHGIGFEEDDELYNDLRIFKLFGSQTWSSAIQVTPQYTTGNLGTWIHYSIPVGQYYTGSNMYLVLVNDHDGAPANGTGLFRNVQIHE